MLTQKATMARAVHTQVTRDAAHFCSLTKCLQQSWCSVINKELKWKNHLWIKWTISLYFRENYHICIITESALERTWRSLMRKFFNNCAPRWSGRMASSIKADYVPKALRNAGVHIHKRVLLRPSRAKATMASCLILNGWPTCTMPESPRNGIQLKVPSSFGYVSITQHSLATSSFLNVIGLPVCCASPFRIDSDSVIYQINYLIPNWMAQLPNFLSCNSWVTSSSPPRLSSSLTVPQTGIASTVAPLPWPKAQAQLPQLWNLQLTTLSL